MDGIKTCCDCLLWTQGKCLAPHHEVVLDAAIADRFERGERSPIDVSKHCPGFSQDPLRALTELMDKLDDRALEEVTRDD